MGHMRAIFMILLLLALQESCCVGCSCCGTNCRLDRGRVLAEIASNSSSTSSRCGSSSNKSSDNGNGSNSCGTSNNSGVIIISIAWAVAVG
jgi:hypothetical protein